MTIAAAAFAVSGCAADRALNHPKAKDASVLQAGTDRQVVIAELGAPVHTEEKDGRKTDLFKFIHGIDTGERNTRAALHSVGSVITFGAWNLIGNPLEAEFSGDEIRLTVEYDENEKVAAVNFLKGREDFVNSKAE
ncbi:MAG: hypothetical protein ACR2QC_12320 [Gammaproteobacteria bacterium]